MIRKYSLIKNNPDQIVGKEQKFGYNGTDK